MDEEKQPEPWPRWKKLMHAAFWVVVLYVCWLGAAKLAFWATGSG